MKSLGDYVKEAEAQKNAIGHFNISNLEGLNAVFSAARSLNLPVIVGVSEKEREFIGVREAVAMVKNLREEFNYPIFINADHSYSFEKVKEAVDAGFDAVIYDGAEQPFSVNVEITKKCLDYAKSKNPNILVEGELGYKGTASEVLKELPKGIELGEEYLTKVEESVEFKDKTGVDLLAPAVGNVHGMLIGGDPALNIKRVKEIYQATKVPLVLHGASGNSADDIQASIKAGVAIVHISTEMRVAYRKGLEESLKNQPDEVATYKLVAPAEEAIKKLITEKLKIFANL